MLSLVTLILTAQAEQTSYQVLVKDKLVIYFLDENPPCLPDGAAAITFPFAVKGQPYQVSVRCEDDTPSLVVTRWEWIEVRLHTTP
ncbi:MAG: hypothetical protein ACI8S6_002945 [Myxococcota bacterium]